MTTAGQPSVGASSASSKWDAIDWRRAEREVRRLQMRIAKATREIAHGSPGHVWPLKGLSGVRGNFHAPFLGERVAARSLAYPA